MALHALSKHYAVAGSQTYLISNYPEKSDHDPHHANIQRILFADDFACFISIGIAVDFKYLHRDHPHKVKSQFDNNFKRSKKEKWKDSPERNQN